MSKEVSSAIKLLLPRYILFPIGAALREAVDGFKSEYGFPQCAGAVDGSHIPIISPKECLADYYNRKAWHSIILHRGGSRTSSWGGGGGVINYIIAHVKYLATPTFVKTTPILLPPTRQTA